MNKHSLRLKFFLFFVGLGVLVFLGAAVPVFTQYAGFIRHTYTDTLNRALELTASRHPITSELVDRFAGMAAYMSAEDVALHKETIESLRELTAAFNLAFVYMVQRCDVVGYRFIVSSYDAPGDPDIYNWDDAPPEITLAFAMGRPIVTDEYSDDWGSFVSAFLPVVEDGRVIAVWGVDFPLDYIHSLRRNSVVALVVAFVISSAIAIVMALLASSFLKPIGFLARTLADAASGDLTKRLTEKGSDEIAMASRSFNEMMEGLGGLISAIKAQAGSLSAIGDNLADNMARTASAIGQITSNIQSIKGRAMNQSASVTQTNATMERVTGNIDKLSGHVERQTGAVSQASSAIEEMIANVRSVTETLAKNAERMRELGEASGVGRVGLGEVVADIREIARESESLLEINSVMQNIASQTNLLSMNAAIEAAHAGESGRGFAVVADEIRKLAESSSRQSKTISMVLKRIKGSIDKITKSTDNVMNKFEAIDGGVKTVAEQESGIVNAMAEQSAGSAQIMQAIAQVNDITGQVKEDARQMVEAAAKLGV